MRELVLKNLNQCKPVFLIAFFIFFFSVITVYAQPTIQTGKSHPYVFYNSSEINSLRTKIDQSPWDGIYNDIIIIAQQAIGAGVYTGNNRDTLNTYFGRLDEVGLVYQIETGGSLKQNCFNLGKTFLFSLKDNYTYQFNGYWNFNTAKYAMSLAALFDSIASGLSPQEKDDLKQYLFYRILDDLENCSTYNDADNKGVISHMGAGVIALLLEDQQRFNNNYGDPDSPNPSVGTFIWAVKKNFYPDGLHEENSQHYHQYTMEHMIPFALAVKHARTSGVMDAFQTNPSLKDCYISYLELAYPNLVKNPTGDSQWKRNIVMDQAEVLNTIYPNTDQLEYTLQKAYGPLSFSRNYGQFAWALVYINNYGSPGSYQPRSRNFNEAGFGVLRYGDTIDAHYAFMDYVDGGLANHDHQDRLAIYLASKRKIPVISGVLNRRWEPPGYPYNDIGGISLFQNLLVVDRETQRNASQSNVNLDSHAFTPNYRLQIIDAEAPAAYSGFSEFERILIMMEQDYVFDLFTAKASDATSHTYDWVHHRLNTISFLGTGSFSNYDPGEGIGYDLLENAQMAIVTASNLGATSYSSENGGIKTIVLRENSQDKVFRADAPGPYDSGITHPIYFVRRESNHSQFAAVHEINNTNSYSVSSLSKISGGPTSGTYGARVNYSNFEDTILINRHSPSGNQNIGTYQLDAKATLIREQGSTIKSILLLNGDYLHDGSKVLIETYAKKAHVESVSVGANFQVEITSVASAVDDFIIWAPNCNSLKIDGQNRSFWQNGNYIEDDQGPPNNPPSVFILYPQDGNEVSGQITILADTGDIDPPSTPEGEIERVDFFIDGNLECTDYTGPNPYTCDWDTNNFPDGTHEIKAEAWDNGAFPMSGYEIVNVTVNNSEPPPPPPPPPQGIIFSDDFEDGNASDWNPPSGQQSWSVVLDGSYVFKHTAAYNDGTEWRTANGQTDWRDYTLKARVKYFNQYGEIGVLFYHNGSGNFYEFKHRKVDNRVFLKRYNPSSYPLINAAPGPTLGVNEWWNFKVEVKTNASTTDITIKLWKEGQPEEQAIVFTSSDSSGLQSGKIGLYSRSGEHHFDDVTVTRPGGGGSSCFLAGTQITMADGKTNKPIEQIKEGDEVLSFNEKEPVMGSVVKTFEHLAIHGYFMIKTNDGRIINVTGEHPVFSKGGYRPVYELKAGDSLYIFKDNLLEGILIESITKVEEKVTVYNLEVDSAHNYFAQGCLVHNKIEIPVEIEF